MDVVEEDVQYAPDTRRAGHLFLDSILCLMAASPWGGRAHHRDLEGSQRTRKKDKGGEETKEGGGKKDGGDEDRRWRDERILEIGSTPHGT